ncbi:MAG: hypothetical protein KAT05_09285, partial [Spirochaetes bacterium]|nr:hypothetical protein [Spirochaetota bacterium]
MSKKMQYCGHPFFKFKQLLFPISKNNIFSWFNNEDIYYIHKARIGVFHLCQLLNLDKESEVLVPAYNCGSEIDPLLKYGVKVIAYKVKRNCEIDLEDLEKR